MAWEQIVPHLDAALGELKARDREAVMLRYFEKKSASQIAATLDITTDAAQKRVSRAWNECGKFSLNEASPSGPAVLLLL